MVLASKSRSFQHALELLHLLQQGQVHSHPHSLIAGATPSGACLRPLQTTPTLGAGGRRGRVVLKASVPPALVQILQALQAARFPDNTR